MTNSELAARARDWMDAPIVGHGLWARYEDAQVLLPALATAVEELEAEKAEWGQYIKMARSIKEVHEEVSARPPVKDPPALLAQRLHEVADPMLVTLNRRLVAALRSLSDKVLEHDNEQVGWCSHCNGYAEAARALLAETGHPIDPQTGKWASSKREVSFDVSDCEPLERRAETEKT